MQRYSENQIRILHSEFKSQKKYSDKLAFFDRLFGIIPFSFPEFDPLLTFLFSKDKTEELETIFKRERNNPGLTERKFCFAETYSFNIKPANSNSSAFSSYILSCFLSRAPRFDDWIRQKVTNDKSVEFLLDEANSVINKIEYYLQNEYDKSFMLQCMSVFYKGFFEAFCNRITLPGKKRKFIELYLYAQGIIYVKYISSLKTALQKSLNAVELPAQVNLDLTGKMDLLHELGIIELLKTKYAGADTVSLENKVGEIICLLTGEPVEQKESVVKMLSDLIVEKTNGHAQKPGDDSGLVQLTIRK
jgi:hypothetical protein